MNDKRTEKEKKKEKCTFVKFIFAKQRLRNKIVYLFSEFVELKLKEKNTNPTPKSVSRFELNEKSTNGTNENEK